jgi:copper chaperone
MTSAVICAVLAAALYFGVKSFRGKLLSGCCGAGNPSPKRLPPRDTDKSHYTCGTTLVIGGMTCRGCAVRVENALNSVDGVFAAVSLGTNTAEVLMKAPVPPETLRAAVRSAGCLVLGESPRRAAGPR